MIAITVPIEPVGQQRARHGVVNGHARTYKSASQSKQEAALNAFLARHQPAQPLEGPLVLCVRAYMPIPTSKPKRWKADAAAGRIRPTTKPDLDNMLKHVKDCLSTMRYWHDDKQVVEYAPGTGKYYSDSPRWEIEIAPVEVIQ